MASVVINDIQKSFGSVPVLSNIALHIQDGEFMTLVGPSGCGKSTLLRIIAGLEQQTSGHILLADEAVDHIRPSERNLAMVFQSYALYPHLSVFDNIAVPLRMRRHNIWQRLPLLRWLLPGTWRVEKEIRQLVIETAESLGLGELLQRKPGQLSGGQRQRVAVGRAIVRQPQAFLLDEPLSNLDAKMRVHMRTELSQLHRKLAATFIYVTHDQAEAMTMSDRIAVMMDGELIQVGTPDEIYNRPDDIRVAEFIGSPKINILPAEQDNGHGRIKLLGEEIGLHADKSAGVAAVGVRPEACTITEPGLGVFSGEVSHVENFGSELFVQLKVSGLDDILVVKTEPASTRHIAIGNQLGIDFDVQRMLAFDQQGKAKAVTGQ